MYVPFEARKWNINSVIKREIMAIKNEKQREHEYNNLLTKENHLKVAKAQCILKMYDLWLEEKVDFEAFKKALNE